MPVQSAKNWGYPLKKTHNQWDNDWHNEVQAVLMLIKIRKNKQMMISQNARQKNKQRRRKSYCISMACISRYNTCSICHKVNAVGPEMVGNHKHVGKEWIKVKVVELGKRESVQQQSLCKKTHRHRTSEFQKAAEKC